MLCKLIFWLLWWDEGGEILHDNGGARIHLNFNDDDFSKERIAALQQAKQDILKAKQELDKLESNAMIEKARDELNQQLASIEKNLEMSEPPLPPEAIEPPAAPDIEELEFNMDVEERNFPSTIEVIGNTDELQFTEENIEKANKFLKFIYALFIGIMILVSYYYLLSCLYVDRKDNSILFWKSLPVSEAQNVLVKFAVALLALPLIAIAIAFIVTIAYAILGMVSVAIFSDTTSPWELLAGLDIFSEAIGHIFTVLGIALWCSPLFAWLLFCSAFAKRSPFLVAVLPVAALALVEKILFGSQWFYQIIINRVPGVNIEDSMDGLVHLQSSSMSQFFHFIASPGLWLGLIICAGFVYGAIWLRDNRYEIK